MSFPTELFGNVVVVHAPEELRSEQSDELEELIPALERPNVVLDMDMAEYIDSRGLTALLNVQDWLRDMDGDAKIATANPINRKIFEITRLDQQLEVFDNIVDAVKSFQQ
jgi:anti-sigma B factor antagonist